MSNKLIDIVNVSKAFDENVVLDELLDQVDAGKQLSFVSLAALRHRILEKLFLTDRILQTWHRISVS